MSVSAATDNVNVISADSERKRSIRRWTDAEDVILRKAVDMHGGRHWKAVAACLQDRTDIQCLHRWQKVLKPGLIKGPWTAEEDAQLIKLVAEQGAQNWSKIAKYIQGRTGKQLSERWTNHLDPNVRKSTEEKWTEEEDNLIFKWHKELGNQWAQIAKYLPGRSENSVKNRFYSAMRRKKPRIYKVPTSTVAVQDSTVLQSQIGSDIGSILHQEHPAKRQRVDSDSSASMLSSSSGSPRLGSLASAVSDIPESSNPTPVSSASLFNPELMKLQEQVLRLQQAVIARDSLLNQVIMRVNSASALEPSAHVFHSLMTQQAISSMKSTSYVIDESTAATTVSCYAKLPLAVSIPFA
eukprot:GILK01004195.1.p1 GENE.GILK01004195.1~~GILK01004195.1.p1  ORF type:complete len:375 (+),score=57.40 GILK01004195.1:67-1125(+)